jgi:TonB-linked SusC/RagA family outer membrane protein
MKLKIFTLLFLLSYIGMFAQQRSITGKVTSSDGEMPLIGVSIVIKGTLKGTITDINGNFSIDMPDDTNKVLVFNYIGYKTNEVPVGSENVVKVVLKTESEELDEIVVVGYGRTKKSLVSGSIAKVSSDDLSQGSNLRIEQALQGKTAGVAIQSNDGQPGAKMTVRIRGTGTNGKSDPLYIVDGLPIAPNAMDFISPSDIESVEVLKDAASAAIYGARGANGVVLITTKQGNKNKFTVSYDAYYGVQNPWNRIEMMNTKEYFGYLDQMSNGEAFTQEFKDSVNKYHYDTDWQDVAFYENAPKQSHVISFSGGSDKGTYSSSFSYVDQEGIVAKGHSSYQKVAYRLNTTRKFGIIDLESNINIGRIDKKGIHGNQNYSRTGLVSVLNLPPFMPPVHESNTWPQDSLLGEWTKPDDFMETLQEISNPLASWAYLTQQKRTEDKLISNLKFVINFGDLFKSLKGLKLTSSYGFEYGLIDDNHFYPTYNLNPTDIRTVNQVDNSQEKNFRWNFENFMSYERSIGELSMSLLAGTTRFKDWRKNINAKGTGMYFNSLDFAYVDNTQDNDTRIGGSSYEEHRLLSYFGRLMLDYTNKYVINATIRKDGSSNFGPANKFGVFPSLSAGWVISRENFIDDEGILSFLKFRASWGQNGNEDIDRFRYASNLSNGHDYYLGTNEILYDGWLPDTMANPFLKWETSEQTNLGLDMTFLQNKVSFSTDIYDKITKNWLLNAPAPVAAGSPPPTINGGSVSNKGIEVELGLQNRSKKLKYAINLNFAYNKSKVLEINNAEKRLEGGQGVIGAQHVNIIRAEVGSPMGYFSGLDIIGVFQNQDEINNYIAILGDTTFFSNGTINTIKFDTLRIQKDAVPGDFKFRDVNGDGNISTVYDRVNLGQPTPVFTGGANIYLEYKGIDFTMFWYTALGHSIWNASERLTPGYKMNYRKSYLDTWTPTNHSQTMAAKTSDNYSGINYSYPSEFWVHDASYLRLKNITLGYTLPNSLTSKIKIERLRIYIQSENLYTFTKYKDSYSVEIGGGFATSGIDYGVYPEAKTYLVGLSLSF